MYIQTGINDREQQCIWKMDQVLKSSVIPDCSTWTPFLLQFNLFVYHSGKLPDCVIYISFPKYLKSECCSKHLVLPQRGSWLSSLCLFSCDICFLYNLLLFMSIVTAALSISGRWREEVIFALVSLFWRKYKSELQNIFTLLLRR